MAAGAAATLTGTGNTITVASGNTLTLSASSTDTITGSGAIINAANGDVLTVSNSTVNFGASAVPPCNSEVDVLPAVAQAN